MRVRTRRASQDLNGWLDAFVDALAVAIARAVAPPRRKRRKVIKRDWPKGFRTRDAWLRWCAQDEAAEHSEMAMDEVIAGCAVLTNDEITNDAPDEIRRAA